MPFKTRGSSALEKAQRRLALLKSIDENLDLGAGLTIEAYSRLIETTRSTLEAHNMLASNLDESRQTITQLDKDLADLSTRMLSGVASIYGKRSIEYTKAGGTNRDRNRQSAFAISSATPSTTQLNQTNLPAQSTTTNESVNSNGKAPVV